MCVCVLQRYGREFKARAAALGVTEAELRAQDAGAAAKTKAGGDIGLTEVVIPLARVRRIVKLDPEVSGLPALPPNRRCTD